MCIRDSVMVAEGCVNCHNNTAGLKGPKWEVGDVRGVIEITMNIEPELQAGDDLSFTLEIFLFIAAVALLAFCFFAMRRISRPIGDMTLVMGELTSGELAVAVEHQDRKDELGSMARSIQVFKEALVDRAELQHEQDAATHQRIAELTRQRESIDAFRSEIAGIVGAVSEAARDLAGNSEALSEIAATVSSRAASADSIAQSTASGVASVASNTEDLSLSVNEIAGRVEHSSQLARQASAETERTNETVDGLNQAAGKISEVIKLINEIAEQTNLLALNATIEASRAGDAGKRFAVVAAEVKALANPTANATDEIAKQIEGMRARTGDLVTADEGIKCPIARV